jgi:hypothetical protein
VSWPPRSRALVIGSSRITGPDLPSFEVAGVGGLVAWRWRRVLVSRVWRIFVPRLMRTTYLVSASCPGPMGRVVARIDDMARAARHHPNQGKLLGAPGSEEAAAASTALGLQAPNPLSGSKVTRGAPQRQFALSVGTGVDGEGHRGGEFVPTNCTVERRGVIGRECTWRWPSTHASLGHPDWP